MWFEKFSKKIKGGKRAEKKEEEKGKSGDLRAPVSQAPLASKVIGNTFGPVVSPAESPDFLLLLNTGDFSSWLSPPLIPTSNFTTVSKCW